jgi:hypothetical protein
MSASSPRPGEYALAHRVAQRLARAGEDPYADDREQYLVLENEEIIEFGRPLCDHRMFPVKSRGKTERLAADLMAFANAHGWSDWRFWSVCRPTRKTRIADLENDYREFNSLLNTVFTYLRKHCRFEYLICGIHVRFDQSVGLFDLHAHFVCQVPEKYLDAVHRCLLTEFSRTHLPDEVVRSPEAVARYIARTFDLSEVVEWPEDALVAAWRLGGLRFHYTRTAGAFAEWRAVNRETPDPHHLALVRDRRQNRAETRYTGTGWEYQDRRLVTRDWRFGDKIVRGSLYRRAPRRHPAGGPPLKYPPAIAATTQTPPFAPQPPTPTLSPSSPRQRACCWCRVVLSAVRRTYLRLTAKLAHLFHRRK